MGEDQVAFLDGSMAGKAGFEHRFINPLLECGDQDFSRTENSQVVDLQNNINSYISQQEQAGALDDASVYFYELNGGQSLDINPSFEFVPASLLKVPLAMSIYQQAEENDPTLLKEKVLFAASEAAPAIRLASTSGDVQPSAGPAMRP